MVEVKKESYDTGDFADDTGWMPIDEALERSAADPDPLCPDGEAPKFEMTLAGQWESSQYAWYKAWGYEKGDSVYNEIDADSYSCGLRFFPDTSGVSGDAVAVGPVGPAAQVGKEAVRRVAPHLLRQSAKVAPTVTRTAVVARPVVTATKTAPVAQSSWTVGDGLLFIGGGATMGWLVIETAPEEPVLDVFGAPPAESGGPSERQIIQERVRQGITDPKELFKGISPSGQSEYFRRERQRQSDQRTEGSMTTQEYGPIVNAIFTSAGREGSKDNFPLIPPGLPDEVPVEPWFPAVDPADVVGSAEWMARELGKIDKEINGQDQSAAPHGDDDMVWIPLDILKESGNEIGWEGYKIDPERPVEPGVPLPEISPENDPNSAEWLERRAPQSK